MIVAVGETSNLLKFMLGAKLLQVYLVNYRPEQEM